MLLIMLFASSAKAQKQDWSSFNFKQSSNHELTKSFTVRNAGSTSFPVMEDMHWSVYVVHIIISLQIVERPPSQVGLFISHKL